MSNLTKKQRDALPLSDFGDPDRRLFPIVDASDVSDAAHLIGKAKNPEKVKARIVAIARRKGFPIPDAWKDDGKAKHSAFAADLARFGEAGGHVLRRGKIFEAGDYPDKSYAMTPEELWAAAEQFAPVPLDLEHTPTVLDGKLGELRAVELGDDGATLYGTVALPKWLDEQLGGACKVSCTWDRDAKTLTRLALVQTPRVSDAAIMAAFAKAQRHDTPHGQFTLQFIHDQAARAGAICDQPGDSEAGDVTTGVVMTAKHERNAMQEIHDIATKHGAGCKSADDGKALAYYSALALEAAERAQFASKRHSAADAKDIQAIHDLTVKQGAACSDDHDGDGHGDGGADMTDKPSRTERFFKWLAGEADTPAEFVGELHAERTDTTPDPEKQALMARIAALEGERVKEQAAAFADAAIRERRALPAERDMLVAQYAQAARDDAALGGTVTFARDGKEATGTRVESLAALVAARPRHILETDLVKLPRDEQDATVLLNRATTAGATKDAAMSDARRAELLNLLPEGRAILRDEAAAKNGR